MKVGMERRGAAMSEYVILLGLITVMGLGAVVGTGTAVKDTFDEVTGEIADLDDKARGSIEDPDLPEESVEDPDLPDESAEDDGPEFSETIRWRNDGSLPLASYVTTSSSGSYRYFTVDLAGLAAAKGITVVPGLKYDAHLIQTGEVRKGSYSTWGYRTSIEVTWNNPGGNNPHLISGLAGAYSPDENYFELNTTVTGRSLPSGVDGIKVRRYLHCNPGSICNGGDMVLDVNIYAP